MFNRGPWRSQHVQLTTPGANPSFLPHVQYPPSRTPEACQGQWVESVFQETFVLTYSGELGAKNVIPSNL